MEKNQEKHSVSKKNIVGIILLAVLFLAVVIISNLPILQEETNALLLLFRPVLIGLVMAYLCNPIFRLFERRLLSRLRPASLRRGLSLALTYLSVLALLACLILIILPQLITSIRGFITNYEAYLSSAIDSVNGTIYLLNDLADKLIKNEALLTPINKDALIGENGSFTMLLLQKLGEFFSTVDLDFILSAAGDAVSIAADLIFAFFISLYLLASKEKRYEQVMRLRRGLFSEKTNLTITKVCTTANRAFGSFFEGRLLDCLIVGILAYIAYSIFAVPYALLISVTIAIANFVPVIGLFFGAVPSLLVVLLSDPGKAIPFLIILIILQQVEGNIIAPKILGSNTGLSSLCIIIALCIMGSLFGILGLLIGVPLFATVLSLADTLIRHRLQEKGRPDEVENYYAADDAMNPARYEYDRASDRFLRHLEKRILHIDQRLESGGEEALSASERFWRNIHRFGRKTQLFRPISIESRVQFAAEEAETRAASELEAQLHRITTEKE